MEIHINKDALERAIQPGVKKLEKQYGEKQKAIITAVAEQQGGQPPDVIYDEIVTRCQAEIPGWHPNEPRLREIAEQISTGETSADG